jgi:acyl-CoA dehydrogenase
MALVLNEEQQMLRESARSFVQECSPVSALRERRDRGEEWSKEFWQGISEMGWTGVVIPENHGGLDFGYIGAGLIMEECGRVLASSPLLSSFVNAALIAKLGSDEQKDELLPAVASGDSIPALALCETGRFDPLSISMTAKHEGGSFVLDGRKRHVIDGLIANSLVVAARTAGATGDRDGVSLFIVDSDHEGISIQANRNAD